MCNNKWLGDEPQVSVGGRLEQDNNFYKLRSFGKCHRIFGKVVELVRHIVVNIA